MLAGNIGGKYCFSEAVSFTITASSLAAITNGRAPESLT